VSRSEFLQGLISLESAVADLLNARPPCMERFFNAFRHLLEQPSGSSAPAVASLNARRLRLREAVDRLAAESARFSTELERLDALADSANKAFVRQSAPKDPLSEEFCEFLLLAGLSSDDAMHY